MFILYVSTSNSSGNYTVLVANFPMERRLMGSIVNTFAPSTLIVSMSWVTFWLKTDAVPARVALSVTSLLTLCTQVTRTVQPGSCLFRPATSVVGRHKLFSCNQRFIHTINPTPSVKLTARIYQSETHTANSLAGKLFVSSRQRVLSDVTNYVHPISLLYTLLVTTPSLKRTARNLQSDIHTANKIRLSH